MSEPMRDFYATAHALLLQNEKLRGLNKHSISQDENLLLFESVEQWCSHAHGFDPLAAVDGTALPVMQALLRADAVVPVSWLQGWIERHGLNSMFEGPGPTPLSYWMEDRLLKGLSSSPSKSVYEVAHWLIKNSPDHHWSEETGGLWVDLLKAAKSSDQNESLIEAITDRGIKVADPKRCQDRWLGSDEIARMRRQAQTDPDLLTQPILAPSGRTMSLADYFDIQSQDYHSKSTQDLPTLPHGRRAELVNKWILDDEIDLDTARSRLWSTVKYKEEVPGMLRERWVLAIKKGETDVAERCQAIFSAKDKQGRSLSAMAILGGDPRFHDCLKQWGVAEDFDLYGEDGAGLMEQCAPSLIGAGSYNSGFYFSSTHPLDGLAIGPPERIHIWLDPLIDKILPSNSLHHHGCHGVPHRAREIADAMPEGLDRDRLNQAVGISCFNAMLVQCVDVSSDYGLSDKNKEAKKRNRQEAINRLSVEVAQLRDVLRDNPLLISVGQEEWRQWDTVYKRSSLLKGSELGSSKELMSEVATLMAARTQQYDLAHSTAPSANRPSRGMRL